MVTAYYKPIVNGVTRIVSLYKRHLEEIGHEVTIFTLGDPDPDGEEFGVIRSPIRPSTWGLTFSAYTEVTKTALHQMDLIHCHHLAMTRDLAHRYANAPIIYTNHSRYDLYTEFLPTISPIAAEKVMRQAWPEFTAFADVVVAPSAGVRDILLDFGVSRPMVVIENGINLERFYHPRSVMRREQLDIPREAVLGVYVGRFSAEKNLPKLLDQFQLVVRQKPHAHLLLIGDGIMLNAIHAQRQSLRLTKNLHLLGEIPNDDLPNYLASADYFVTASITETDGLSIIEAMAAGLPVVGQHSPGISDIVQAGFTGLLTHPHQENGLSQSMLAMIDNPPQRHRLGRTARMASQRYAFGRTFDNTLQLYERTLSDRPDLRRPDRHGRWYREKQ